MCVEARTEDRGWVMEDVLKISDQEARPMAKLNIPTIAKPCIDLDKEALDFRAQWLLFRLTSAEAMPGLSGQIHRSRLLLNVLFVVFLYKRKNGREEVVWFIVEWLGALGISSEWIYLLDYSLSI